MYSKDEKNLRISQIHHKRKDDMNSKRKIFRTILTLILSIFITAPMTISVASSQQLVLLDVTYDHTTATKAFSFFNLPSGLPTNLVSPVNYAQGTLYQRLQVITKPSSKTVKYQICIFQDKIVKEKHACSNEGLLSFTGTGTYYANQPMTSLFQYSNIAWSRSLLTEMLVVKDVNGKPVDDRYGWAGTWSGSPNFALYYPMKVRYTAIVVSPGGGAPIWPGQSTYGSIVVVSPNGGEKLIRGTTKTISWSSNNIGSYVKIDLLKGGVLNKVITSSTPNDGSYSWLIPTTQTLGTDYKIRVTSTSKSTYSDVSNANFAISDPYIRVIYPNGGESWNKGSTKTITWTKAGNVGSYVKIELLKSGAVNRVISWSTPNDGSFSWYIPSTQSIGSDYKIRITSTSYSKYTDSSNYNFKIY